MMLAPSIGAQPAFYNVDGSNVHIDATGEIFNQGVPRVSVVVLKDPLIKEAVNITYP
jgi:hypothetical protein